MKWELIRHKDLDYQTARAIAEMKNQHWPYGIGSQIDWMNANVRQDDMHLIGREDEGTSAGVKAYLTLSHVEVNIDGEESRFFGIGGVCVDKTLQHTGTGKKLVEESNRYIKAQNKPGILLCKGNLVQFYEKCGWHTLIYQSAEVAAAHYKLYIMTLDERPPCKEISIDRNF